MTKLEQAARQALEALEEIAATRYPSNWCEALHDEITALREALAEQAEQEPVSIDWDKAHEVLCDVWNRVISADDGFDELQDLIYAAPLAQQDTHATHVVRTKDLTEYELDELRFQNLNYLDYARAVIAADRAKNNLCDSANAEEKNK